MINELERHARKMITIFNKNSQGCASAATGVSRRHYDSSRTMHGKGCKKTTSGTTLVVARGKNMWVVMFPEPAPPCTFLKGGERGEKVRVRSAKRAGQNGILVWLQWWHQMKTVVFDKSNYKKGALTHWNHRQLYNQPLAESVTEHNIDKFLLLLPTFLSWIALWQAWEGKSSPTVSWTQHSLFWALYANF